MLNMCSTTIRDGPTARPRIRDAAIDLFGRKGFSSTSIREIARAADVAPGLVIHHFGSKEELRAACDDHVVDVLLGDPVEAVNNPTPSLVSAMLDAPGATDQTVTYMARMLIDPTSTRDDVFRALVNGAERHLEAGREAGSVNPSSDTEVVAALVTAMGLAQILLRDRLTDLLGNDPFSTEGARRLTLPTLELFTHGLYSDDSLLNAAKTALHPDTPTSPDNPEETT